LNSSIGKIESNRGCLMTRAIKIYEAELYEVWKNIAFQNPFETETGQKVEILDPGEFNKDSSGPDFRNARVKIDNLTYVGDVEIDRDYNDWKHHGHNIDRKYNKVILHVCFINKYRQNYVYNKEGRKIVSVCLADYLGEDEVKKINEKILVAQEELSRRLRCHEYTDQIDFNFKKKYLMELGVRRFDKKCTRIFDRLKELAFLSNLRLNEPEVGYELTEQFNEKVFTTDDFKNRELWEQTFYEFIFEALGYSKNKSIMLKLARSAKIDFLKKLGEKDFVILAEASLFGIAGLLPKKDSDEEEKHHNDYTLKLQEYWENIKKIYDGKTFDETDWHFFKLRPQNFPTIRIAGGARLLKALLFNDLLTKVIKKATEIRNINVLINSIKSLFVVKASGYWKKHYVFDTPGKKEIRYFIGYSRVDEMMVNVILPFLSVYFNVFKKEEQAKKVISIYKFYRQNSENSITREMAENLRMESLLHKSVYAQGMIELFRSYCSKNNCLECKIGEQIFN